MGISACFGVIFVQTPAVPFIFLNRRLYLRWCSFAMGYYLLMVTVCFEFLSIPTAHKLYNVLVSS